MLTARDLHCRGGCRGLNGRGGTTGSHHEQDCNSDDERSGDPGSRAAARDLAGRAQGLRQSSHGSGRPRPRHPGGRVSLLAGAVGLRQVDGFAVAGGPHGADAGRDCLARELPGTGLRVSGADADAVVRRVHQRVAAVAPCRSVERKGSAADRRGARASRAGWFRQGVSAPAIRRHEDASVDRPRPGDAADGPPDGRAVCRSG